MGEGREEIVFFKTVLYPTFFFGTMTKSIVKFDPKNKIWMYDALNTNLILLKLNKKSYFFE